MIFFTNEHPVFDLCICWLYYKIDANVFRLCVVDSDYSNLVSTSLYEYGFQGRNTCHSHDIFLDSYFYHQFKKIYCFLVIYTMYHLRGGERESSDADPQWLFADPDPPNLVSADPDPGSLTIKIKSLNFSKNIYSISLISKSKILLIFKSEPKS